MLNNNLLADRLNAYKNNEPIPAVEENNHEYQRTDQYQYPLLVTFLLQFFNLILVFVKSLGYGFAAKTIFSADWKFAAFLSVGFAFELFITSLLNPFTKTK
jgi:hypothetical protein